MEIKELIGKIAGIVVLLSALPYLWAIVKQKTHPTVTSWAIWSLLGISILATYKSDEGTGYGFWSSFFGAINPVAILICTFLRSRGYLIRETEVVAHKRKVLEKTCFWLGITTLGLWITLHYTFPKWQTFPLFLAIIADAMGLLPTVRASKLHPENERPFMWIVFSIGYGLSIFALKEYNFVTLSLPIYMVFGPAFVFVPLVRYRIKNNIPFREWY